MQKLGIQVGDIYVRSRLYIKVERSGLTIYQRVAGAAGVSWPRAKEFAEDMAFAAGLSIEQAGPKDENPRFRFIENEKTTVTLKKRNSLKKVIEDKIHDSAGNPFNASVEILKVLERDYGVVLE